MQRIWPGEAVEESNLAQHIKALRQKFGGDLSAYIETVPKRGYRFVPPVTESWRQ